MAEVTIDHHCVTLLSSLECSARKSKNPETSSQISKYIHTHLYVRQNNKWYSNRKQDFSQELKGIFCHKVAFSFPKLFITKGKNYLKDEFNRWRKKR